jgi:translation initiation factor IF-3
MIRIPQVRVVDEEGAQLGVMPTPRALEMAQERGLDLVEVAPMAAPPVVKFLDFGQYKYDLTKREKEAKRKQRSVTFKEVRLSPKIGTGDFDTKVHRAIEFLEDGDRIKVTVRFRGRELTHPELGRNLLAKFVDRVKEHGVAERTPLLEGKSMHITMASLHKPKTHEPGARGAESQNGRAEENIEQAAPTAAPAPVAAATPARPAPAGEPAQAETPVAAASTVVTAPAAAQAPTTEAAAPAGEAAATDDAPKPAAAAPAAEVAPAAATAPATAAPKPAATTKTPAAPKPRAEAKTTTKTEAKKTTTPAPEPVTSGE